MILKNIYKMVRDSGEFPARIRARHKIFWSDPLAEDVRNDKMDKMDPLEKWMNVPNWQRKLSNKFNAREFAKMQGCQVPDLYWKGRDIDSIDFSSLPAHYVIRPTIGHSANLVYLMKNGLNLFDNKTYTPDEIKQDLKKAINNVSHLEFLFEEFVQTEAGEYTIPNDYKFLCFRGVIASIAVIDRVSPKLGYSRFYNENWQKMKKIHFKYPGKEELQPPLCLNEMLSHAKKLSKAYGIFVRLDFFATNKGPVFGEFTPTPSIGKGFTPYGKKLLLDYWDKYCPGLI